MGNRGWGPEGHEVEVNGTPGTRSGGQNSDHHLTESKGGDRGTPVMGQGISCHRA